jgi:hypothetical protein
VQPNSPAALEVRANPAQPGTAAARPERHAEKIADGVWALTPGAEGSILVEFKDYLVIVEGPGNDAYTMATLAQVR